MPSPPPPFEWWCFLLSLFVTSISLGGRDVSLSPFVWWCFSPSPASFWVVVLMSLLLSVVQLPLLLL